MNKQIEKEKLKATKYGVPVPPKKARLISTMVAGQSLDSALSSLKVHSQKAAYYMRKLLQSALSNAINNHNMTDNASLYHVKEARVDDGIRLKRRRTRNKGSSSPALKRRSNFTVVIEVK